MSSFTPFRNQMPARSLLLVVTLLLAGCSSASTRKVIALDDFRNIYVERPLADNHQLDKLFVAELQRLGRVASSGPRTMMPEKTDAVLTYSDRWQWDFKDYLIEMNIELHTARTHKKLADGRYHQPSIRTKPPEEVVRELLGPLFGK
jgi:hypothetical protein